jgi:hypothetical protein
MAIKCTYYARFGEVETAHYSSYAKAYKEMRDAVRTFGEAYGDETQHLRVRCSRVVSDKIAATCKWKNGKVVCTGGKKPVRRRRKRR